MITVIERIRPGWISTNEKQILCPYCNIPIYFWQMYSLKRCPWCKEHIIDAELIAVSETARIAYHLRGEY